MNKQLLNKFLIISLLLIWSIIGYKLISNFIGKEKIENNNNVHLAKKNTSETEKDKRKVFVLANISRDPFLGIYMESNKETSPVLKSNNNGNNRKAKFWPTIEYYGFVRNENRDNPLVLLKINNNLERIRKGSRIDGLYVKEIFRDSILIIFGSEKKIIVKKQL